MGLFFPLLLFVTAISTSVAGPLDKSFTGLGHGIGVRVNLDTSDGSSSSDGAFVDSAPILPVDSGGFSDSLLPADPNTNPSQGLPTEPYLIGASLSDPEGSYFPNGSGQFSDIATVGGILLADAGNDQSLREAFDCNSNTAICCKGNDDGKTKPCNMWTAQTRGTCTDVHIWNSCCSYWGEVDNASDEYAAYTCYSGCTGDEMC